MTIFLLCIKIFFARILDVTIGTVRTVVTVKGKSLTAALLAFVEVFVWFVVAKEALNTGIDSLWIPIAYAGGFAAGTYLGTIVANNFIKGVVGVQVITNKLSDEMIKEIRKHNFAVSIINLHSIDDTADKKMLFIQINNNKLKQLTKLIKDLDQSAFIVVNDTKFVQNGFIK